jgi:hypothetical protein
VELPKTLLEIVRKLCRKRHWGYLRFFNAAVREFLNQIEQEGRGQ